MFLLTLQGMQAQAGRALPPHISEWGPPLVLLARVHRCAPSGGQELEPGHTSLVFGCIFGITNTQDFPEIATCAQHRLLPHTSYAHQHNVHLTISMSSLQCLSADCW